MATSPRHAGSKVASRRHDMRSMSGVAVPTTRVRLRTVGVATLGSKPNGTGSAVDVLFASNIERCFSTAATTLAAIVVATAPLPAKASGEAVFNTSCAACHRGGGNIVQPGAALSLGDLQRNGVLDVDKIYQLTYNGKGKMYGFGEGCTPKGKCAFGPRLSDTDISDVSQYVYDKATNGW